MSDCLFCRIVNKEIPSVTVYEDDFVIAIKDIKPIAPMHLVVIPKEHIANSATDISAENSAVIGKIFEAIANIAKENNLSDGFRIVNNCGDLAGQSVLHIHFHLLSGKKLSTDFD